MGFDRAESEFFSGFQKQDPCRFTTDCQTSLFQRPKQTTLSFSNLVNNIHFSSLCSSEQQSSGAMAAVMRADGSGAGNHSTLQHKFTKEEWKILWFHPFMNSRVTRLSHSKERQDRKYLKLCQSSWIFMIWCVYMCSSDETSWTGRRVVCVIQRLCSPLCLYTFTPLCWWRCQQMERGVSMCHIPASEGWASFCWSVLTHINYLWPVCALKKKPGWS